VIDGQKWTCTYTALPEMYDPSKSALAAEIRASSKASILFGSLVRGDKLTEDYARAVRRVLEQVPRSLYIYAGHQPQPWFEKILAPYNAQYIGWIDTRLWVQVIDVYLDTYPFQSGHTVFESMAASKPIIWMHNPEYAAEQGVTEIVMNHWSGVYSANPVVMTSDDYVASAVAVARDPVLQRRLGAANRVFFERFMRDERRMVASVSKAIIDVIKAR